MTTTPAIRDEERAPTIRVRVSHRWFHGSPLRLEHVAAGSTVTPVIELAKAFSHKPSRLETRVEERDGRRIATVTQNGTRDGFLYEVIVTDPAADLRHHPTSRMALGEEMLVTRDLPLRYVEQVPASGGAELRVEETV